MISPDGHTRLNQKALKQFKSDRPKLLLCACALVATIAMAAAAPNLNTQSPLGFFTNVASSLLSAQLNLDATRIQIYPTNQYTPAVHRLFQLAANIYEATSTNSYPSVFRPLFSRDAGGFGPNLFIRGFTNVDSVTGPTDSQLTLPINASTLAATNIPVVNLPVNVYGIPWIIGARKGFPNFNEFAMESAFQLTRRLQVTRPSTNSPVMDYQYNQMFLLSLTNQLGVECWNSYTDNFTDPVTIYVTDNQTVTLTNDEGFSTSIPTIVLGSLQIPNGTSSNWPGYNPIVNPLLTLASFQIPLNTNAGFVPLSTYRFNVGGMPYLTTNFGLPFETGVNINGNLYPQPHWGLTTSNDLRVIMMDTAVSPYRIIDYIQLSGPNSSRDLTQEIINNYDVPVNSAQASGNELWNTIFQNGFPIGIMSQIGVSLGVYTAGAASGVWNTTNPTLLANEIDGFRVFFGLGPVYPNNPGEPQVVAAATMTNVMQAPFIPIATVVQHVSWQVNDPLVHYLANDLNWAGGNLLNRNADNLTNEDLGQLNQRYMPWGGNPMIYGGDQNSYNLALKDPLVWHSDDWDFPTNESLSGAWLGRVHRGTPWQTVYLKASNILNQTNSSGTDIGTNTWMAWTGDMDATDAAAMAPVQDWHLASLLSYLMNTNDLRSLFSVNNPNPNAWLSLLDGMTAWTNSLPDPVITFGTTVQFNPLTISSNSPQASFIVSALQSVRAGQPNHYFLDVGDILAIPRLTEQSPFLNWNDSVQQQNGISDEAYEIIPSQLLPLLRADSVGSIASMNGQVIAQFTGYDEHTYVFEISSNLVNWASVSTNFPMNRGFNFTNSAPANAGPQFYRSLLLQ